MSDPVADELLPAWSVALPHVLKLLPDMQSRMFRGELQKFLAMRRMKPDEAEALVDPLRDLLLQALRTAGASPALHATRVHLRDGHDLERVINHILASWRGASRDAAGGATRIDTGGRTGEVFFGPRLGGPGRAGALKPSPEPPDED